MNRILRLLILFAFAASSTVYAESLSDGDAVSIISKRFGRFVERIPLGAFSVIGGVRNSVGVQNNFSKGEITEAYLNDLKAWESQGVIKVTKQEYDKGSMKQFSDLTSGVVMKVNITATPKGLALQKEWADPPPEKNSLLLLTAVSKTIKIVRNEERKVGIDDCRIIMVSLNVQFFPVYKEVQSALKMKVSENKKSVALLKHDPFQSKWQIVAWDIANQDEDFKTSNVNDYMKKGSAK